MPGAPVHRVVTPVVVRTALLLVAAALAPAARAAEPPQDPPAPGSRAEQKFPGTIGHTAEWRQNFTPSANLSSADTLLYHPYQHVPTRGAFMTRGSYANMKPGTYNNFHFGSYVETTGSAATVAGFFEAIAKVGNAVERDEPAVWAINPVAYVDAEGGRYALGHGVEVNGGPLGGSPGQEWYGIVIGMNSDRDPGDGGDGPGGEPGDGDPASPNGLIPAAIQIQGDGAGGRATAAFRLVDDGTGQVLQRDGRVVDIGGVYAPEGSVVFANGSHFDSGLRFTFATFDRYAVDLSGANVGLAAIRLPGRAPRAGSGPSKGLVFDLQRTRTVREGVREDFSVGHASAVDLFYEATLDKNYMWIGDFGTYSGTGIDELRFHVRGLGNAVMLSPAALTVQTNQVVTGSVTVQGAQTAVQGLATAITPVKTSSYAVTTSDSVVVLDTSRGGFAVTLPATGMAVGQRYTFKMVGAGRNAAVIDGNGRTIDGARSISSLDAQWESCTIVFDGANWLLLDRNF